MANDYERLLERHQHPGELDEFAMRLRGQNVTRYLEIGSKFGCSLWRVANCLPIGSRIVAVDLPDGTASWGQSSKSLEECVAHLNRRGYQAMVVWGDSTDSEVIGKIANEKFFGAVFIDANHTYSYVRSDWLNYGHLAPIVAFHDIAWKRGPDWQGMRIDAPKLWEEVRGDKFVEIKLDPSGKNNGIGMLWH